MKPELRFSGESPTGTPGPAARAMVTPARSTSAASVFRLTDPAHAVTAEEA